MMGNSDAALRRELQVLLTDVAEDLLDRVPEERLLERVRDAQRGILSAGVGGGPAALALRILAADLRESGRATRNADYHARHLRRASRLLLNHGLE